MSPRDVINEVMHLVFDTSMGGGVSGRYSSGLGESSARENASKHVVRVEVRGRGWLPSGNTNRVVFDEIIKEGWSGCNGHCPGEFSARKDALKRIIRVQVRGRE